MSTKISIKDCSECTSCKSIRHCRKCHRKIHKKWGSHNAKV